jgi:hypothetical protein
MACREERIGMKFKCPKGHEGIELIMGVAGAYCSICDRLYIFAQLREDR